MISNATGRVIAVLLALILAVLLFGREAVGPWIAWGLAGLGSLLLIWFVINSIWRFGVYAYGDDVRQSYNEAREKGGSSLLLTLAWIGCFCNVFVVVWAVVLAMGGMRFRDAFFAVPLFWLPMTTFMVCYGLNALLQKFYEWRHERT